MKEKSVIVPYIERTTWFPVYEEKSVTVPYIERTTWFPVYDEKSVIVPILNEQHGFQYMKTIY